MHKKLRELCSLKGGSGFPEKYQGSHEGEIPFIKVSDMNSLGNERFITTAHHYVSASDAKLLNATAFNVGTIVFAKVGAALLLNRRRILIGPTIIDNNMMAAIPSDIDSEFLYYFLCSVDFSELVQSGALPSVNQRQIGEIKVPSFSKLAQQRIAAILTTIDTAIEKTEALIAKYQQIKAGLMHDLFTRGVLPNGQLRPPRSEAPELYQETSFGWIPREWQYELLDNLASRGSGHTPNKDHSEYWNGGIKWVSLADSYRLDQLYISDTDLKISHKGIQNSSAVLHPAGIVVLSRDAGVGKSAITTESMAVSQHFMCWKCDQKMNNHFLYYWLQYNKCTFENIAMGSTILTIGLPYFKRLKIACPINMDEQLAIASKLRAVDSCLFAFGADLKKTRHQKHGLMQDLLTGKVPVQVEETNTEVTA